MWIASDRAVDAAIGSQSDRSERVGRIGVELWEEDLWREIIQATLDGHADQVPLDLMAGFERPACSRYAATTPTLLNWFRGYNEGKPYAERIRPFNFLLSLQTKSALQSAAEDPYAAAGRRSERQVPRPAAPYDKDVTNAAQRAFDRKTGRPIPMDWLKSLGRSLVRYHLHPEAKFRGGDYDQRGQLSRRHVLAETIQPIGKEADDLEEREFVGSEDAAIEYDFPPEDRTKLISEVKLAKVDFGLRSLTAAARVSHHQVNDIISGKLVSNQVLMTVSNAARALENRAQNQRLTDAAILSQLRQRAVDEGRNKVARELGIDPSNLAKVLTGKRRVTKSLLRRLTKPHQRGP